MIRRRDPSLLIGIVVFLIFISNVVIFNSLNRGWQKNLLEDVLSRKHIAFLIQELSMGHLYLEESIHGDRKVDNEKDVLQRFRNAQEGNINFLQKVKNGNHIDEDIKVFSDFNKTHTLILSLYNDAMKRLSDAKMERDDTQNDLRFDHDFNDLLESLQKLDAILEKHFIKEFAQRDQEAMANIIFLVTVNVLMFLIIYLIYRARQKYERYITEQKKAFETLFEKSSDGILLLEDERVIDCNESVLKMLHGRRKDEVINKHPSDFSPSVQADGRDSFAKAKEMIELCLKNGVHSFEWIHRRLDGKHFWVDVVLTTLTLHGRTVIHVGWRDISKRKALEASLQQKSQLYKSLSQQLDKTVKQQSAHLLQQSRLAQMGEMINMIAHQWRQPLAAISAIASNMTLDILMDEYNQERHLTRLDSLSEMSQHLSSTIDVFRSFFQEDKSKMNVKLELLINGCMEIIGPLLASEQITVHSNIDSDFSADIPPNELKQVILNLIKNAQDILSEEQIVDPQIWIETHVQGEFIHVTIEDNAGGIPVEIMDSIFDPYFTTKSSNGGTGLGLYMSKIIIEEHCSGYFSVENSPVGAKFTIALPAITKQEL